MKLPLLTTLVILVISFNGYTFAQKKRPASPIRAKTVAVKSGERGQSGVVIDENLSVLRVRPSLFSESIQRMRLGRKVTILGVSEADGVKFYRVTAPPSNSGWVQSEAIFGSFRHGDEERLARLVQASSGFEQIEVAAEFFRLYPTSKLRPTILLMFGDLLEETAAKLSRDASRNLSRKEMAASAAPLHSFYLNFVGLDRYRKLKISFQFNPSTKQFHYDGASWKEIVEKFPASGEAVEAQKRLDSMRLKLERTVL